MRSIFLARQPIFNKGLTLIGYELLYRNNADIRYAFIENPDLATTTVVLSAFAELGLEKVVGNSRAYINLTRNMLLHNLHLPFPQNSILEILEDVGYDDAVYMAIQNLKNKGYTIALDDFVYTQSMERFIYLADIVKIDILTTPAKTLALTFQHLRKHPVQLLAEKIETYENFMQCRALEFDYYQGYFLGKPQIISGHQQKLPSTTSITLLQTWLSPELDLPTLQATLNEHPQISYQVTRLQTLEPFTTVTLGAVRNLACIVTLSKKNNVHHVLFQEACMRAHRGLILAQLLHKPKQADTLFLLGLLSLADALLNRSLDDLLIALPLSAEIFQVLHKRKSSLNSFIPFIFHGIYLEKVLSKDVQKRALAQAYTDAQTTLHLLQTV